ncbi:MAG: hypothetical protein KDC75_14900 [Phaeodactylibacter sp.]|nr:hypothetical protein [Phaeodactylibacter sp.]
MINIPLIPSLLLSLLMACSACNGQGPASSPPTQAEKGPAGRAVAELGPKANLIFQDRYDNYWFGSKDKGVYKYDGKSLVLFTAEDGLCGYAVLSAQEDQLGNLYFDTPEGVCRFDGRRFSTLEVVESDEAKNEWTSGPDDLWFRMGWDANGPYRFDGKNLYHLKFPKNEMEEEFRAKYPNVSYSPYGIYSIYRDRGGNMWFGTSSLGLYRFDGKKVSWMYEWHLTETPGGGAFGIRSVIEDKDGYFWICNPNYKYRILPDSTERAGLSPINYQREAGIENQGKEALYFLSMVTGDNGDLWMVTFDNGVWRNDGERLTHYPVKDGERDVLLSSIYKDNRGRIWIGTQEDGAYTFNGRAFEKFKIN